MEALKKNILNRLYLLAGLLFTIALAVFVKLINIQVSEGPALREKAEKAIVKPITIEAAKGNVYSSDERLLATSIPHYEVRMDVMTVEKEAFDAGLKGLTKGLSTVFGSKSARAYEQRIRTARKKGDRYLLIKRDVSYSELQKLKTLPIFKLGKYKGGLIYEQRNTRKMPFEKIAERTIGYDNHKGHAGIEGAYSNYLSGSDGKRLKQKIAKGVWKPLNDNNEIEPIDGQDIITTIDTRIQDIAHHALLRQLEIFEADHGSVVVMDVKSGEIKAIANLGRTEVGTYFEKRNYAVWESTEPGSTFKLFSLMIALEDGAVDTADLVDTKGGIHEFYGVPVRDSRKGGYGVISFGEAFVLSSNVGIAKKIHQAYGLSPHKFVDKLFKMGLNNKIGFRIIGEGHPKIPQPNDADWSKITLPWMSYGYSVSMTPLQILTYYNAIANEGVMVKPFFVKEIRHRGKTVKSFHAKVLNTSVCSKETLGKVKVLLEDVVRKGTAKNIYTPKYSSAGKTGTCQLNYWKKNEEKEYQSSFAGYFPADQPKYSCIVVINKPKAAIGYYGATVAAPVFKEIADRIHTSTPAPYNTNEKAIYLADSKDEDQKKQPTVKNQLPDLRGLPAMEAIALLENIGINVQIEGNGKVIKQSLRPGTSIRKKMHITLKLG